MLAKAGDGDLDAIGVLAGALDSLEQLYAHLPEETKLNRPLALDPGKSEYEIYDYFKARAAENADGYASFLGAGVYSHYRPVLCDVIASRGEFLTSYTPYQAEMAQGTLTSIFEFQTMICQLTGMEVANASMYDGSTAVPEAAMMAMRITGREHIVVASSVHPEYRQVLGTYARNGRWDIDTFGYDAQSGRLTLALLEPPREADIVVGELQSFAISPSYGGPFAGVMATKEKFMRQIPGRLVGETKDANGNRAFCLTLSTREQHIRREKATSNICTNQALIALTATVFLSVYGKEGLRELALQNLSKAHYLSAGLKRKFDGPFFNEFVVECGGKTPEAVNSALLEKQIVGGLPLGRFYPELADCVLLCATEMSKRAEMDLVRGTLEA